MKQRHRKHQRALAICSPAARRPATVTASLDEGLAETFPASDPVSVSITRIETAADEPACSPLPSDKDEPPSGQGQR